MSTALQAQLIDYLRTELAVSSEAIALAERHQTDTPTHLHIVLWQYGLITLEQLAKIFDWLETSTRLLPP